MLKRNGLKITVVIIFCLVAALLILKKLLVRTVNYEIAGIMIPSEYNVLTGTVKPIPNYKGRDNLPTVATKGSGNVGLTDDQVIVAKLRWAVFEEWVKTQPEYRGWQEDPEIFKKADDHFRKQLEGHKVKFRQIK